MKYIITVGEKKNLGNYESLHVEVTHEFDNVIEFEDGYDFVADKLDFAIQTRLKEIQERKETQRN